MEDQELEALIRIRTPEERRRIQAAHRRAAQERERAAAREEWRRLYSRGPYRGPSGDVA